MNAQNNPAKDAKVLAWLKDSIAEHQGRIDKSENCPHCGIKLQVGAMSWKEHVVGCYKNDKCPYYKENGLRFRTDIGHSMVMVGRLERDMRLAQTMKLLRQLRDNHPMVWNNYTTPEVLDLWDGLKKDYEEIEKVYDIVRGDEQ